MTAGVEDACKIEHASVLSVCGIGRRTEDTCQSSGKTVAYQCAVKSWLGEEVPAYSGRYGAHIADMLHDSGESDWHDSDDTAEKERAIEVVSDGKNARLTTERQAYPCSIIHAGEIHFAHCGSKSVGCYDAEKDWHNLYYAFSPDTAQDDYHDSYDGEEPVARAILYS